MGIYSNHIKMRIPKGKILWHARYQSIYDNRRNVMKSPDYLFTSPQMSQALLHGIDVVGDDPTRMIELTKLKVKEPLVLLNFAQSRNQVNYARTMYGIQMKPFGLGDIKLIKSICAKDPIVDGYRAFWDQDQITLCARSLKKVVRVATYTFRSDELPLGPDNVSFNVNETSNMAYYISKFKKTSRQIIKNVKRKEKVKAVTQKSMRKALYSGPPVPVAPAPVLYKRPALRKKKA
jgi:hypothetical protein